MLGQQVAVRMIEVWDCRSLALRWRSGGQNGDKRQWRGVEALSRLKSDAMQCFITRVFSTRIIKDEKINEGHKEKIIVMKML